jgi:hypothetical protein
MIQAYVDIESQSNGAVDFGDKELHFIINGASMSPGKADFSVDAFASTSGRLKPGYRLRQYTATIFDRRALEQLSKANRIEMRLGSIEPKLSNQLITILREYATQVLAQYKIAKERKP